MVSTMLVERQAGEISLLKSRGATTGQVMQIYVIEGCVVLARGAGPWAAAGRRRHRPPGPHAALPRPQRRHQPERPSVGSAYVWAGRRPPRLRDAALAGLPGDATDRGAAATASARPPGSPRLRATTSTSGWSASAALLFYQLNRRGIRHAPAVRRAGHRPGAAADAGVLHPHASGSSSCASSRWSCAAARVACWGACRASRC